MTAASNRAVTIITIGRNSLAGLQATVASVESQTYPALHHVLIDGASTDGSAEWLAALAAQPWRRWHSDPDDGIYDAMNKALAHVEHQGYLLYLHAGDTFVDADAVQRAMSQINVADPQPDLAIGWSRMVVGEQPLPYVVGGSTPNAITSAHESTFFSTAFHANERYDTSLQLAADYAFFRKLAIRQDLNILRLDTTISNFAFGGRSNDPSYDGTRFLERARINDRFGESPTMLTYLRIAARMMTRSVVYRVAGADRAAELFLRLACRRGNSGARAVPVGQLRVGGSSAG